MQMNSNDAISQKIWNGSVPVSFCIFHSDVFHELSADPPPFLMLVPRVTYFPLVLEKTILQFHAYLQSKLLPCGSRSRSDLADGVSPAQSAEESRSIKSDLDYWLSYDGIPLKWHYPVGLLFDLYGSPDKLPWEINVHFGDYPSDILLAPPVSSSAVEAIFLATLKEADQLKHRGREGPGPIFDGLLPEEQRRLWSGLLQHRFDLFWSINKRFMQGALAPVRPLPTSDTDADPTETDTVNGQATRVFGEDVAALMVATGAMKAFRHCPFRVYFSPHAFETSPPTMTYLQTLVSPFIGVGGTPATFSDVIVTLLKCSHVQLHADDFIFLVHGVQVPPETPAQWMCEWMAYPDNFVHIVACKRKE